MHLRVQSNREPLARLLRRRGVGAVRVLEGGGETLAMAAAMTNQELHSIQLWLLDKEMPITVRQQLEPPTFTALPSEG